MNVEVAEIINGSSSGFQQLPLPFYERDVVVALHQLTQRVNSGSTYEQIQKYLYDFDTRYGIIFRDDSKNRGLVFPQYMENKEVRLELEALDEAIIESRLRLRSPETLESKIINKYNKYKRYYPLEGGKRKKRNSQRKLRLHLRSNRRKNKNKKNKKRRS